MSDTIELEVGRPPWLPSSDAELTDTFVYNNMPIVGLVRENEILYLFRCVEGFADTTHVWVYAAISNEEADFLRSYKDHLWDVIGSVGHYSPMTVALATDDNGLLLGMDLRPEKGLSLLENDVFVDAIIQYGAKIAQKGSKEEEAVFRLQEMTSPL